MSWRTKSVKDWGRLGLNSDKNTRISFNSPLNRGDSEIQTVGCRHTNPDICGSNSVLSVCAFVRDDGICTKPSAAWKKQYKKLMEGGGD